MTPITISREQRYTFDDAGLLPCWQWCIENLGRPKPYGDRWTWDIYRKFEFRDELDATMFALLWVR